MDAPEEANIFLSDSSLIDFKPQRLPGSVEDDFTIVDCGFHNKSPSGLSVSVRPPRMH